LHSTIVTGAPKILIPVKGFVSSGYGYRDSPFSNKKSFHEGYDIVAPIGTPVYAPLSGRIKAVGFDSGFGRYIILENKKKKLMVLFGHLKMVYIREGGFVKKGTRIGSVGMTGRTTGPHLHYEVKHKGVLVNPKKFLL
jgi:murein DD-endopeptidase MepM/ murein hydrolase activator NlpD